MSGKPRSADMPHALNVAFPTGGHSRAMRRAARARTKPSRTPAAYWTCGEAEGRLPGGGRSPGEQHGARTRSLGLVGLAMVGSGLLVNSYLAIIARSVSAAEYAYFGAFWSLALVVGFGFYLPIEQETARLMQIPEGPRGLLRAALLTAVSVAAGQVVLVAAATPLLARALGGHGVQRRGGRRALPGQRRPVRRARRADRHGPDGSLRAGDAGRHAPARDVRGRGRAPGRQTRQPGVRLDARRGDRARARTTALPARHPPHPTGPGPRARHPHRHRPRGAPHRRPAAARLALRAAVAQRAAGAHPRAGAQRARGHPRRAVPRRVHPGPGALFLVVPLQTALRPMLTALLHSGGPHGAAG